MNFLFPTVSNKKSNGQITIEDFKSIVKKEVKKGDIIFKDEKFQINKSFLENRHQFTGFVGVINQEGGKAYLLKSTTEEAFANTLFVKGEKAVNTFSSDSLKFVIENAGVSLTDLVYLNYIKSEGGYDVYEISNTENTALTMERKEDFSEDVEKAPIDIKPLEEMSTTPLEKDYRFIGSNGFVDANNVPVGSEPSAEVDQFANQSVEEVSPTTYNYQEESLEQLL